MGASPDQEQDREAMERLAAGHDAALNALMERHGERLFHFLVRELQNESEASDLAEETFVRVYHNRHKFDPSRKFTPWLYAIAVNLVRDRFRWRARHPEISADRLHDEEEDGWLGGLPDQAPLPGEMLDRAERAGAVKSAIAELPEELRTPLLLAEYQQPSHAEIATILKCSTKAVEMRVYRARQQLKTRLAEMLSEA